MNWINTDIFSHKNYFPARRYAVSFSSPPDGNTAIKTLPTWSFFQADQHQIADQINSGSSIHSIAGYAVKITIDAYLTITRLWQSSELFPTALGPTQTTILKPQSHYRWRQLFNYNKNSKKEENMTKNKTTRDTSFSQSWQLIDKYGLDTIRELWEAHGIYQAGKRLNNASPFVIRYIVHKNEWTRDASKVPHLVKAVQNGRAKASDYKSLDFKNVQVNNKSNNGGNSNEQSS